MLHNQIFNQWKPCKLLQDKTRKHMYVETCPPISSFIVIFEGFLMKGPINYGHLPGELEPHGILPILIEILITESLYGDTDN